MTDFTPPTLLNPHADDFLKCPVSFWLTGRRGLKKYAYIIDEPINQGHTVNVLIDGTLSSLIDQKVFTRLPLWLRRTILKVEVATWLQINNLDNHIKIHWTPDTITDRRHLYLTSYKNCVGAFALRLPMIAQFQTKVVNLSHYFIRTGERAANIQKIDGVVLTAEADLRDNAYFRHFFGTEPRFLALPFFVPQRFEMNVPLSQRSPTCAATGSFHNLREERPAAYYQDFIRFFNSDCYHPVRKILFENQNHLADVIACKVSPYREKRASGGALGKALNLLGLDFSQKAYFSFDIVAFYNAHTFAIIGEEISGLPAVGFFEAMACGSVVLGDDRINYASLGLVPGVHYLPHDGTLDSITNVITTYTNRPDALEAISQAGQAYIAAHCRNAPLWQQMCERLASLTPDTAC